MIKNFIKVKDKNKVRDKVLFNLEFPVPDVLLGCKSISIRVSVLQKFIEIKNKVWDNGCRARRRSIAPVFKRGNLWLEVPSALELLMPDVLLGCKPISVGATPVRTLLLRGRGSLAGFPCPCSRGNSSFFIAIGCLVILDVFLFYLSHQIGVMKSSAPCRATAVLQECAFKVCSLTG